MTRRGLRTIVAAVVLVAVVAGAAMAQERSINETRAVDAKARIKVDNLAGLIDVSGWDRNEVQITGTLDEKAKELAIEGSGSALRIKVKYPEQDHLNIEKGSRLTLKVPRGCELETESVSAEVKVTEVNGKVSVESVSGSVTLRGAPESLDVETVSGEIVVEVAGGRAELASVSGDILARGVGDKLEVNSVSGEIEVTAAGPLDELSAESVSGSLKIAGAPTKNAQWDVSAHSGDVDIAVPADVSARFSVETFSGSIRDGFGHEAEKTDKYAPGRKLSFTQGAGDAEIDIESFSGDVILRKQ